MQYKDLLRGTVLLAAVEATALGAISGIAINNEADDLLAALALAWWVIAIGVGIYLGRADRTAEALRDTLASAKTATQLPSESPASIGLARLWPLGVFAIVAGGLGAILPQVPAIAAGMALLFALAWRKREAAVTAIEERDGVCFYVEKTSAFQPVKLVRTPGLMRGAASQTP
ncbi:MAG TPA: hypothetical protein VKA36_08135 [Solirubrobacterales bacterium]|nr:hypothetical protein [Solirubrobacterales bacterium]